MQETVTERERIDALKFFVAAFVVLPLLPDRAVGPYDVWVPQRIWLLVVLITAIGWVGYAATRAVGARRGLLITGLAGGFVSATATTGVMAAKVRQQAASERSGLVMLVAALWLARTPSSAAPEPVAAAEAQGRPFALVPALLLAGVITLVLPLAAWLEDVYGTVGSMVALPARRLWSSV